MFDRRDKGAAAENAIRTNDQQRKFVCDPAGFVAMPGGPFAYWVSNNMRGLFKSLPAFEGIDRTVKVGLQTSEDDRFVRAVWEIAPRDFRSTWFPFAKGGKVSAFYADLPLTVDWREEGAQSWAIYDARRAVVGGMIKNPSFYFRAGLTWPLRARKFSPQPLPAGCIFSLRSYCAFTPPGELLATLAILNSSTFDYLYKVALGRFEFPEFVIGILQKMPLPTISGGLAQQSAKHSHRAWATRRALDTVQSTSHAFFRPALLAVPGSILADRAVAWAARVRESEATVVAIQAEIDDLAFRLYGLDAADRAALTATLATEATGDATTEAGEDGEKEAATADVPALVADLLAYALGCAFGRWDIRYATGERSAPEPPDPFAPLPVCPPGQLQNAQGLPASPEDLPSGYPLDIPWDGVLLDDAGHDRDLAARSRRVFDVFFADAAEAAWSEAAETLEGRGDDLRAWIARSLFADHIKRYSKSRRKAPIYWQLATPSASYSVWLYYHRFTRDTFYKVLNDYVTPKLRHEERKLTGLVQDGGGSPTASQRKEIAEQEAFVAELRAFREEVARVAPLWNPDLNDGVIINFAPLWRLAPQHRAWQKECKACWDKLVAGDYDWAHLAMNLWPERVVPKCAKDRSLAIAHCLEHVFWEEGDDGKWQPLKVPQHEIDQLIAERISAAIKDALKSLLEAPPPVTSRRGGRRSPARTKTRRKSAGSRSAAPDTAVLDALKRAVAQSSAGISKGDALAATGLSDSQWNAAVKVLLADGSVTKTGAGRGTRYHSATGN